jgi:competence protein ComEC
MGDAEQLSERQIMNAGFDIDADVLKVGHHGSSTTSSESFLKAVAPTYAVTSVGKNNQYGLPANSTLQKLAARQITILRTDIHGTILIISDGATIEVETELEAG